MVIIPIWLEITRSRFRWKTKCYNILNNIKKLSFLAYFYYKKGVSFSMIKGGLFSKWFSYLGMPSGVKYNIVNERSLIFVKHIGVFLKNFNKDWFF